MLNITSASGFGANYAATLPETIYPAFSQTVAFTSATSGTRIKLPNYVNTIRVYAWGGGGAGGGKGPGPLGPEGGPSTPGARRGGTGGDGGYVKADFPVPPGSIIYVRVAGGGSAPGSSTVGGSGGGYSSVELPQSFPAYHLLVAGGGGGGGRAPTVNSLTPSPAFPAGDYYPGSAGGPAFASGSGTGFLFGSAATVSTGGVGGYQPIGGVPVPVLGPVNGPIYGPLPPSTGPSRAAESGTFLRGGGAVGGAINGGGAGNATLPPPAWPGTSFEPGPYSINNSGGGGGGYYGGGAAHPRQYVSSSFAFGDAGGSGGSSYINPAGSNTAMANSGPYTPNPVYSAYYSPTYKIATGGIGMTPPQANWSAEVGGDGLVVIVY
jgi:hypothetical protein